MQFVHNSWYVAGSAHEIRRENLLRRTLLGQPVVLFRTADGKAAALADRCSHRHAPLSLGSVVGNEIQCPYHGLRFDTAGRCTLVPSQAAIPSEANIRSYPVVERHRWVWLWMGDPAKADPAKIVDYPWVEDPAWRTRGETLHFPGNYMMVIDNLLDLSHTTFLHATTLGTPETVRTPIKVTRDKGSLDVVRWVKNAPPSPQFGRIMGNANIDRGILTNFTPPGFVRILVATAPAGTGAPEGDLSGATQFRTLIAVTPETATTCWYFRAICHDFLTDDPSVTDYLFHSGHIAMEEDRQIIRSQRDNMAALASDSRRWVDIGQDAGALQGRRMVEAMIAEEQGGRFAAE